MYILKDTLGGDYYPYIFSLKYHIQQNSKWSIGWVTISIAITTKPAFYSVLSLPLQQVRNKQVNLSLASIQINARVTCTSS